MLRLRVSVSEQRAEDLARALSEVRELNRLVATPVEFEPDVVLVADVAPAAADRVVTILAQRGLDDESYILERVDVIAPTSLHAARHPREGFAWVELVGEARLNSRPLARYLVLMAVAGVIAALGVTSGNTILIVGAMAVSPDLLPVCAICVAIVFRRRPMAERASATLALGLALVAAVAAVVALLVDATGLLGNHFLVGEHGVAALVHFDYSTVLVALAAGIAAILSFETRAGAAVGVAISVTTIPASAYAGVAFGVGEVSRAWDALAVLGANVGLLLISGILTLLVQRAAGSPGTVRSGA